MILGVVSDTHNSLPNVEQIIDIFNENKVDSVVHAGDITQAKTLSKFAGLNSSLYGVNGNNDLDEKGLKEAVKEHGFNFQYPPFLLSFGNRKIAIFHEPDEIEVFIERNPDIDLVIHGHTHRYRNETIGKVRVLSPGECAGMIKGENTVVILNLEDLSFERVFF